MTDCLHAILSNPLMTTPTPRQYKKEMKTKKTLEVKTVSILASNPNPYPNPYPDLSNTRRYVFCSRWILIPHFSRPKLRDRQKGNAFSPEPKRLNCPWHLELRS